jgi:hypothetical protein
MFAPLKIPDANGRPVSYGVRGRQKRTEPDISPNSRSQLLQTTAMAWSITYYIGVISRLRAIHCTSEDRAQDIGRQIKQRRSVG